MDELTIAFKIESPPSWLPIGRTAENNWRTVEIDCSYWFNMNADGEVVLMYKPSCGMSPYPLLTERDGDNIIWRPKSGELVEGVGRLQAFFEVGTDVIGSSDMISCEVDSSLLGVDPGTDPGQTDLPWALDIIEQIAELSGHYPKIIDGDLYIWDSTLNDWVEFEASGGGAVDSVNGKTGVVVLDASDVGALPDDTPIPAAVTEQTVSGWGFTKNTGTYSKPSGGIPASDLASTVQASLSKADTALQQHQSLTGYATETWVQNRGYQTASQVQMAVEGVTPFEIPFTDNSVAGERSWVFDDSQGVTASDIFDAVFAKKPIVARVTGTYGDSIIPAILAYADTDTSNRYAYVEFAQLYDSADSAIDYDYIAVTIEPDSEDPSDLVYVDFNQRKEKTLPTVTASDNGKFLRVVNGAWAAQAESFQTQSITDTGGYYTTDTVEGALQEIGAELAGVNTLIGTGVIS